MIIDKFNEQKNKGGSSLDTLMTEEQKKVALNFINFITKTIYTFGSDFMNKHLYFAVHSSNEKGKHKTTFESFT